MPFAILALPVLAFVIGANVWLAVSTFIPILRGPHIEYVFVAAPGWQLAVFTFVSFAGLAAVHLVCSRWLFDERPARWTWNSLSYVAPLGLFAFNFVALLNLTPAAGAWLSPWSYLAIDLRPWLAALVLILWIIALDARSNGALRRRACGPREDGESAPAAPIDVRRNAMSSGGGAPRALEKRDQAGQFTSTLWLEMALVAIAATFVCISTPLLRFNGTLHGDEPKYLRYCENLYQGRGLELSGVKRVADLPADDPPHILQNVRLLADAIPLELRALWDDVRRLREGGRHQRFNRAKYLGGWIIEGKRGGVYQVHLPGVSFLMFPAYFIDRYVLDWTHGDPQFPREMMATVTCALGLYLVYTFVIFKFLADYTRKPHLAFGLTLVSALTLPLAGFPFQLYPEVAAGIFIVAVTRYILFGDKGRLIAAAWFGLLAGYLPWFHVRYLAVSALLLAGILAAARRRPAAGAVFAAGWALSLGSMALYAYHVTGSLLPTALYDVRGEAVHVRTMGPGLFGFLFDSAFGVVAQAPVLAIAIMGLPRLIGRRTTVAIFCGLIVLVTAATGAAHTFTAALTTPGRYLVGVMPFAMLAVAEALETFKTSRVFKICFALLVVVSIQTAWVYNLHHIKEVAQIVDTSFSGWKVNLLFPIIQGFSFRERAFHEELLWMWAAIYTAIFVTPIAYRIVLAKAGGPSAPGRSYAALLLMVLVGWGSAASLAGAVTERRFDPAYLMAPKKAGVEVTRASIGRDYWLGVSSTRGRLTRKEILNSSFDGFSLTVTPLEPRAGDVAHYTVWPRGGAEAGAWGAFDLDFGDGQKATLRPLVATTNFQHTYAFPGFFEVTGHLVTGLTESTERLAVSVRPASAPTRAETTSLDVRTFAGLPPEIAAAAPTLRLDTVSIRRDSVCIDSGDRARQGSGLTQGSRVVHGSSPEFLWIALRESEGWQAHPYPLNAAGCMAIGPGGVPLSRGQFVAFLLATEGSAPSRSEPAIAYWPTSDAILDVPIIIARGS